MRSVSWLSVVVVVVAILTGCATDPLATSSQADQVGISAGPGAPPPPTPALVEATHSVVWDLKTSTGNDIWPSDLPITTTSVLIRKGPDNTDGATFLAFVVWNGNVVGKIFRVQVGNGGADFRSTVNSINATRTFGIPDRASSSSGNAGTGGVTPLPHPNVDGPIAFSATFLHQVKLSAQLIQDATADFLSYSE
jgi:hypothetical protein